MSIPTDPTACHPATAAVRAGIDRDTAFGAVTPPIVLSSNVSFDGLGNKRQYDYTRSGNPTRDLLGEALAGHGPRRWASGPAVPPAAPAGPFPRRWA